MSTPRKGNFQTRSQNRFRNNQSNTQFIRRRMNRNNPNKPNRDAVIARNLQTLSNKKKVAQNMYYGSGKSPLLKTDTAPTYLKTNNRGSIQNRLGNNQSRISKGKVQNRGGLHGVQNFAAKKNFSNNGLIRTIGTNGKIVYLKPVKTIKKVYNRKPTNFSVSINNDKQSPEGLNPHIQQEIKEIQIANRKNHLGFMMTLPTGDLDIVCPTTTRKTMHERFSQTMNIM